MYLAPQGAPLEVIYVSHSLNVSIDSADATLVSNDTYGRLFWWEEYEEDGEYKEDEKGFEW